MNEEGVPQPRGKIERFDSKRNWTIAGIVVAVVVGAGLVLAATLLTRSSGVTTSTRDFSGFQAFEFNVRPVFVLPQADSIYTASVKRDGQAMTLTVGILRPVTEANDTACVTPRINSQSPCLVVFSEERALSDSETAELEDLFRSAKIEEETDACRGLYVDPTYLNEFRWDGETLTDFECRETRLEKAYADRILAFLAAAVGPEPESTGTAATTGTATTTARPQPSPGQGATTATAVGNIVCPKDVAACDFAGEILAQFVTEDWDAAASSFRPSIITCPGPPYLGLYDVACLEQPKDTEVEAVYIGALAKDGTRYAIASLASELARVVTNSAGYTLYAIGMPFRSDCTTVMPIPADPGCRTVVLADGDTDRALVLWVRLRNGTWAAESLGFGSLDLLVSQPDRMGRSFQRWEAATGRWTNPVEATTNRIEYDASVATGGDCLNIRQIPRLDGTLLSCLPDGTELLVRDTKSDTVTDGITWIYVSAIGPDGAQVDGYAAKDFVKPD